MGGLGKRRPDNPHLELAVPHLHQRAHRRVHACDTMPLQSSAALSYHCSGWHCSRLCGPQHTSSTWAHAQDFLQGYSSACHIAHALQGTTTM